MTTTQQVAFVRTDGGRAEAGFRGTTGDCVTRALAIATGQPYLDIYNRINEAAMQRRVHRHRKPSAARTGVPKVVTNKVIAEYGGIWTPTMFIGSGCTVHVRADELPEGRLILNLSGHVAAFIDGVLHDGSDCSRAGTRCVYGFWTFPTK